jgi:hypothetical protein
MTSDHPPRRRDLPHGRHYDDLFQKGGIGDRRFRFCDLRQAVLLVPGVPHLQRAALARGLNACGDLGDLLRRGLAELRWRVRAPSIAAVRSISVSQRGRCWPLMPVPVPRVQLAARLFSVLE